MSKADQLRLTIIKRAEVANRDDCVLALRTDYTNRGSGPVGWTNIHVGSDWGERDLPPSLLLGFPSDQLTGEVLYLKGAIVPFNCRENFLDECSSSSSTGRCYSGNGPCFRCTRKSFPLPTYFFPSIAPVPEINIDIKGSTRPNLDVFCAVGLVLPSVTSYLRKTLDKLGKLRENSLAPNTIASLIQT